MARSRDHAAGRRRSPVREHRRAARRHRALLRRSGVAVRVRAPADERGAQYPAGRAVDDEPRRRCDLDRHLLVGQGTAAQPCLVERAALGGDVAREDAVGGTRAAQDPYQHDHSGANRHGSRAATRRNQRKPAGHSIAGTSGAGRRVDSTRTIRGAGRLRPGWRLPVVRCRLVYHRRVSASGWRSHQGTALADIRRRQVNMVNRDWRRQLVSLAVGICLAGVLPDCAFAQGAGGQIEGTVRDQQSAVLPGATVTLRNDQTGVTRVAVTETDGRYLFPSLAPGTYSVKVELQGFATTETPNITITIGLALINDFSMKLQSVSETVTVAGTT